MKFKQRLKVKMKRAFEKLPKFPCTTRWGEWFDFIEYVFDIFQKLRDFLIEHEITK